MTLGLPADTYDTVTAKSQRLPISQREMDIVRALEKLGWAFASWMLTSES